MLGDRLVSGMMAASASEDEPSGLLDIETALKDDTDGRHRAALLKQLENGRNIVRRQLDRGVSPDEYRRLTRVLEACDAAATVLEAPRGNHG